MAKKNVAATAQEVKEKYGRKRLSSSTAGKHAIYELIYASYQINEQVPIPEIQPLFRDIEVFKDKVHSGQDVVLFNSYAHLQEWTSIAFDTAVIMRNALKSTVYQFRQIVGTAIAGEQLRDVLGEQAEGKAVSTWLNMLTVDNYASQENRETITALRGNIATSLRYLNAYNTYIDMIASAIDVPEFTIFKVDMVGIDYAIKDLNLMLNVIGERVSTLRSINPVLTETLKAFEPVEDKASPIPRDTISLVKDELYEMTTIGSNSWARIYQRFTEYWRQN